MPHSRGCAQTRRHPPNIAGRAPLLGSWHCCWGQLASKGAHHLVDMLMVCPADMESVSQGSNKGSSIVLHLASCIMHRQASSCTMLMHSRLGSRSTQRCASPKILTEYVQFCNAEKCIGSLLCSHFMSMHRTCMSECSHAYGMHVALGQAANVGSAHQSGSFMLQVASVCCTRDNTIEWAMAHHNDPRRLLPIPICSCQVRLQPLILLPHVLLTEQIGPKEYLCVVADYVRGAEVEAVVQVLVLVCMRHGEALPAVQCQPVRKQGHASCSSRANEHAVCREC